MRPTTRTNNNSITNLSDHHHHHHHTKTMQTLPTENDALASPQEKKKKSIVIKSFYGSENDCYSSSSSSSSSQQTQMYTEELSKQVVRYAENRLENACKYLQVDPATTISNGICKVRHSQIQLGRLIGKGSFHNVYEVKYLRTNHQQQAANKKTSHTTTTEDSHESNSSCNNSAISPNKVVVKMLRRKLMRNPTYFAACAADLVKEGCILASLQHDHILPVRGMTPAGLSGYLSGRHDAFFLLLDRMEDTLQGRLNKWCAAALLSSSSSSSSSSKNDLLLRAAKQERRDSNSSTSSTSPEDEDDVDEWNISSSTLNSEISNRKGSNRIPTGSSSSHRSSSVVLGESQKGNVAVPTFHERLKLLAQIADALEYLHKHRIMCRDIKPDNVGFDQATGTLKLFDLDVARILPPAKKNKFQQQQQHKKSSNSNHPGDEDNNNDEEKDDNNNNNDDDDDDDGYTSLFRLTKQIGSRRYMSPECGKGEPYNLKSDVYSFGLVCHEVLTLLKPFEDVQGWSEHQRRVFLQHERPVIPCAAATTNKSKIGGGATTTTRTTTKLYDAQVWSFDLKSLMESCWSHKVAFRPTMHEVHDRLNQIITGL